MSYTQEHRCKQACATAHGGHNFESGKSFEDGKILLIVKES